MYNLVIADTSCLIVLEKINRLELLHNIFDKITITFEVKEEFGKALPTWIDIETIHDRTKQKILELELDKGEASAITLALENEKSLLLIDEKKGRKIAQRVGLKITGTLGILIRAKEKGMINSLNSEIEKLKAVNFRMSNVLIEKILDKYE